MGRGKGQEMKGCELAHIQLHPGLQVWYVRERWRVRGGGRAEWEGVRVQEAAHCFG